MIERQVWPAHMYGLFAINNGCGALDLSAGMNTDSYDSAAMTFSGGLPVVDNWGGHVGTNGNMHEQGGQTIVKGSLSTPRSGVGTCQAGAITAVSTQSGASMSEGIIKLPQAISWPLPELPSPMPPTTAVAVNGSSTCATFSVSSGSCTSAIPLQARASSLLTPKAHRWRWATLRSTPAPGWC